MICFAVRNRISSRGKGSAAAFVKNYKESRKKAGEKGLICIPSGNHDMDRLARTLHGDELKVAFAFLLTMPGAPFIYYGDEIGLRYVEIWYQLRAATTVLVPVLQCSGITR